jgi:MarR family transcriptional regulator for hemolysin
MSRRAAQRDIAQIVPPLSRSWHQRADTLLAEFGVSNSMAWCLIHLDRMGPAVRQIDLAQAVGITQPSIVRVLDQLEAAGLVTRAPDPQDRRSNHLILTGAGNAQCRLIEERLVELRETMFDGISDSDIETTRRVLFALSDRVTGRS